MKLPDTIIDWIESNIRVPQGDHEGESVTVLDWQRRFLRGVFRRSVVTSAMSLPRANGKSSLAAFIASSALWGPISKARTSVVIVASSIDQGAEVFDQILPQLPDDRPWGISNSKNAKQIRNPNNGVTLRVLGSEPRHLHGLKSSLFICDEPAQWGNRAEKMFAALRSATGKIKGCKLIALGTMPANESHWFSRQVKGEADYAVLYQSKAKKTWWSIAAMRKANPSWNHLPTLRKDLERQRNDARRDEAAAVRYRALNLNQGVEDVPDSVDVLIEAKDYARLESDEVLIGDYILGLDPADGFSQFGASAVSLDPGIDGSHGLDGFAAWPSEDVKDIPERSKKDGVDYRKWIRDGDLVLTSGPVVDIPEVLETAFSRWGRPACVVTDFYRFRELRFVLEKHGYTEDAGNLITRRASMYDGSEDYRAFARMVRSGDLAFRKTMAMRESFGAARTVADTSGNVRQAKFHERSTRSRDDIAAAAVFGIGELTRRQHEPVESGGVQVYHVGLPGGY